MSTLPVQPERIKRLNERSERDGRYVLYWMQQSQRERLNHALEYAVWQANAMGLPLLVAFGLTDRYPEANERHYRFMVEGLQETDAALAKRGIRLVVQLGEPDEVALRLTADAALLVCDRGYLRQQKVWRRQVADEAICPAVQIESDAVVPVETASDHAEFAVRTIRPKIHKNWDRFLVPLRRQSVRNKSPGMAVESEDLSNVERLLGQLDIDRSVPSVERLFRGGERRGRSLLRAFLKNEYDDYANNRNQPQTDSVSHMSKYLHFGQISPLEIALAVQRSGGRGENEKTYLEELIVRRELALNFVEFTPAYDRFECLPNWARTTLDEHRSDRRDPQYTRPQLESSATHDAYWNAAMREMVHTGYMHNYMRMYWGKKILQWSSSPQQAFRTALHLNNKYFLDGRDANSFAGVAWVFGMHDPAFAERPVYGKVRYMSAAGLRRKCDIEGYVEKVERLCELAGAD